MMVPSFFPALGRQPYETLLAAACALAIAVVASAPSAAQLPPDPDSARALEMGVEDGFTVASVGDVIISAPISDIGDSRFLRVARLLHESDLAFGNFDNSAIDLDVFHGYPAPLYGGLRLRVVPQAVHDLKSVGFDIMARANNHTTDWGIEGLRETSRILEEAGIVHAGAGETLAAARAGRYLETPKGRVALVSMASSFTAMAPALDPLGQMRGRPGLSALRTTPYYFVTLEELGQLRRIRDEQPEGPAGPAVRVPEAEQDDELSLFGVRYKVGDRRGWEYEMNEVDLREILHGIRGAKRDSDFVIATIHAHDPGNWSDRPPEFLEELARKTIDAGADQFVGTGPHQLRGIEIYEGRPIFYSLGNFFFQIELQSPLSRDLYQNFNVDFNEMTDGEFLRRWLDRRFDDPIWYESVVAHSLYEGNGVAEIRLYPVELGYEMRGAHRGVPRMAHPERAQQILETLQRLSEPYGTEISIENGVGVIRVHVAAGR